MIYFIYTVLIPVLHSVVCTRFQRCYWLGATQHLPSSAIALESLSAGLLRTAEPPAFRLTGQRHDIRVVNITIFMLYTSSCDLIG